MFNELTDFLILLKIVLAQLQSCIICAKIEVLVVFAT